jgi:hypothetical protein
MTVSYLSKGIDSCKDKYKVIGSPGCVVLNVKEVEINGTGGRLTLAS